MLQRGAPLSMASVVIPAGPMLDADDLEDLEDAPDSEVEAAEEEVLDQATASRTIAELKTEIGMLAHLELLASNVRRSGTDKKWYELAGLLDEVFARGGVPRVEEPRATYGAEKDIRPVGAPTQKLVIFTEHRDTLSYLHRKISDRLGRQEAVQIIHGGMGREERLKAQESFKHDPEVKVLIATDAAGEGINLQRAHLMVNYDLPWNPNRLEQRFGRIHRIGQTEVCHLWNLVADKTREGEVYLTLLEKLELARKALGGQVFDVLGKLVFEGKPLRELLIEAVRYGERPDIRAKLTQAISGAVDLKQLQELIEDRALANTVMDATKVARVRDEMERADARRLQPHYIESFFIEAFKQLGGTLRQRESRRYEVTHVPAPVRNRDRLIGLGDAVLPRYERIAFEKSLVAPAGQTLAAFVCPGHPLLDATLDLTLERHRDLLRRGSVLVDETDSGSTPRVLFYLEHEVQDACETGGAGSGRRAISKQMLYVELDAAGNAKHIQYAPYLDYRPLAEAEVDIGTLLSRSECNWVTRELEAKAMGHAIAHVVPSHLKEVRDRRMGWIGKTRAAVRDRLTKEIAYWDHRAQQLQQQESTGQPNAKLNSQEARRRADDLQARLQKRLAHLDLEAKISALPPVVLGGLLVLPKGLLAQIGAKRNPADTAPEATGPVDTQVSGARARAVIMEVEARLGFHPVDRELEKLGYDIESKDPATGHLRFIEVKGRISGAESITVTRNEILYSLNKPEAFILAIVEFHDEVNHSVHYVRRPFRAEPDFAATSVNYSMRELLALATAPT